MVGTRHNPGSSGTNDEEIYRIIADEVAVSIREAMPKMFGSIKTTLIETFDERYVVVANTDVAAARPHGGDLLLLREFNNTKPPKFDET